MQIAVDQEYTASVDALAYALALTERRIQQLDNDNVISKIGHGKYNFFESIRAYCEFLRQSERGSVASKEEKQERIKLTRAKRRMAELAHGEATGALVRADTMRRHHLALARILKNNLETMPDRIDAIVAAESDAEKCREIILQQVRDSLNDVLAAMDELHVDPARLDQERRNAERLLDESPAI